MTREDFGSALAHYEEGNLAFERAREAENRARLDLLTAEVLAKMGSRREAWQRYRPRARRLDRFARRRAARHAILGGASFASLEEEMPSAALAFQNELLTGKPGAQRAGRRHRRVSAPLRSARAPRRHRSAAQPAARASDARDRQRSVVEPPARSGNHAARRTRFQRVAAAPRDRSADALARVVSRRVVSRSPTGSIPGARTGAPPRARRGSRAARFSRRTRRRRNARPLAPGRIPPRLRARTGMAARRRPDLPPPLARTTRSTRSRKPNARRAAACRTPPPPRACVARYAVLDARAASRHGCRLLRAARRSTRRLGDHARRRRLARPATHARPTCAHA